MASLAVAAEGAACLRTGGVARLHCARAEEPTEAAVGVRRAGLLTNLARREAAPTVRARPLGQALVAGRAIRIAGTWDWIVRVVLSAAKERHRDDKPELRSHVMARYPAVASTPVFAHIN